MKTSPRSLVQFSGNRKIPLSIGEQQLNQFSQLSAAPARPGRRRRGAGETGWLGKHHVPLLVGYYK